MAPAKTVLEVEDLSVEFDTPDGTVRAVNQVSFSIEAGSCYGVAGESGSGKTQLFLSIMREMPNNAKVTGKVIFNGRNLLEVSRAELDRIRGARIAYVMQDALSALTPHKTIGDQLIEVLRVHEHLTPARARQRAVDVLDLVRIPEPGKRMKMYPHELSGGMRQRVLIGSSILCEPDILIADEPTTALDATVQAQVMEIFDDLRVKTRAAIVLITHDLGVLAGWAHQVMIMYAGRIVEAAPVDRIFAAPCHPYSRGLLSAVPRLDGPLNQDLQGLSGMPPNPLALPQGCAFAPRCSMRQAVCEREVPRIQTGAEEHRFACHFGGPA
ncbi:MAG: ABC transporter ATP-binding protein [Gammaproteobacteria bacterium]|nr:ABC transporter ATP-binding protein [Gammaproteobacteria bacterium]MYF68043.1 ABC transporter ATP-binding protein [Gammaproteobacteria bacterium]MYK37675.1 ABC transporter ATP-binding protein [Gammaproteobacteria bacterium]